MTVTEDIEAEIRRLHYAEHWPVGTVASQTQQHADVVRRVNYDRGRVLPSFTLNASVGADLWKREKRSLTVQVDVTNVTDRMNLINFTGMLSGTAIAPPRGASARVRWEW